LTNPQLRAALGLGSIEEVVILQRQQELQRDFHLRQMLLQEQMEQQTRLESMLHEQQLKAIGDQLLAHDRLRMQAEEELRRRQLLAQQHQHNQPQALDRLETPLPDVAVAAAAAASSPVAPTSPTPKGHAPNQSILRDIAADSLAGNAVRRSDFDRRTYAKPEHDALPPAKKRARSTHETGDRETTKRKPKKEKKPKKQEKPAVAAAKRVVPEKKKGKNMKPSALALLGFASSSTGKKSVPPTKRSEKAKSIKGATVEAHKSPSPIRLVGTLGDILEAAECEDRNDNAAKTLTDMKENVVWSESEEEVDETEEAERMMAISKGDTIQLPNFSSFLPQLPEEPELETEQTLKKRKKHKSLLDDDSVEEVATTKRKNEKPAKGSKDVKQKNPDGLTNDLLYPIDTWWPSVASIKREKKLNGERYDDDDLDENAVVLGGENQFRANLEAIKERLANDVQPGVLEKIPHCKIHRMLMQKRKNPTAPELVYCWQVTELYPNDIMVCCSHCGTWRHAACGGHCKPYSVREAIVTPFAAVCDRCQEEENILADYPIAQKRLERQRCEQIRRGLATSATMRQASFSKHGGTYKWPLGSVSATHIGGHTRSVHSRHDKAEKQWTEMATKLGRGYGYRPKERVKVRTKELERLLVSVEDAGAYIATAMDICFVRRALRF
jgi:hypothetical protein